MRCSLVVVLGRYFGLAPQKYCMHTMTNSVHTQPLFLGWGGAEITLNNFITGL